MNRLRLLLLLVLAFFGSERQAHAYTDPGSGALLWQGLVAGIAGSLYYVRRFAIWFSKRRGSKN